MAARRDCKTAFSLLESNADVGSSNSNTSGDLINARAIASRCRCPPDNALPPSPTRVSNSRSKLVLGSSIASPASAMASVTACL
mmetsp:Transcript_23927/g.36862  ORF Transcript_23927/g.36862 Transcript_23927/m.36862 type:complete len:84 (-) Transcript_23927:768-1019(-)